MTNTAVAILENARRALKKPLRAPETLNIDHVLHVDTLVENALSELKETSLPPELDDLFSFIMELDRSPSLESINNVVEYAKLAVKALIGEGV